MLTILKTIGDFFLDAKGDGDPMRAFAVIFLVCAIVAVFTDQPSWACGGFAGSGLVLFVLAIWHDREPARKQGNPTQGQVG